MSGGGGTQKSIRKVLGSLKDTTTVSLAKVNSGYKELDIAIVKATNHVERPAKEKYIRAIFSAVCATRPRADVAYCIHGLARRLAKTHNWAVALKTLIVIHRALREVDPTFHEELMNYGRSRNHMLNLSHFKDDSSPNAWDYSTWIRTYALFLEERLECCRVLKYDVEMDHPRTKDLDTVELLEHLPALQQLLFRVLGCQQHGLIDFDGFVINPGVGNITGSFVIRDSHGAPILSDIRIFGKTTVSVAETFALRDSLIQAKRMNLQKIIIEGDSQFIINCINKKCSIPWKLKTTIEDIKNLVASHVYRETNFITDKLAKKGYSTSNLHI